MGQNEQGGGAGRESTREMGDVQSTWGTRSHRKRVFSRRVTVCLRSVSLVTGNNRLCRHTSGRRQPSQKTLGLGKIDG